MNWDNSKATWSQNMDDREKVRRAKNQRLLKLYGITIKEYEERLAQQNGCCAVCLKPPRTLALSVDHDHKCKYLKLNVRDGVVGFVAQVKYSTVTPESPYYFLTGVGDTKSEARAMLKDRLKRASIRGLLCVWCNTGLRKYRDNPENLFRAAAYLRRHQGG